MTAGGFTATTVGALATVRADGVEWNGLTYSRREWAERLARWEELFPNVVTKAGKVKRTPNETEAERTKATTLEANVNFCWDQLPSTHPCIPTKWRNLFRVDR